MQPSRSANVEARRRARLSHAYSVFARPCDTVARPQKDLAPEFGPDRAFEIAAFTLDHCRRNAFASHHLGLMLQGGGKKFLSGLVRKTR